MIPKKIHYCWFGRGEKPKLAIKCINSWKKYCPNYELVEWNEDNFPINDYPYAKFCYQEKKWAFLSDFVRLVVIYNEGGVYFDTDVELIQSPDELLQNKAFYGFENNENVNTGLGFGAESGNATVKAMLDVYLCMLPDNDGNYPSIVCPKLNTEALIPLGLKLNGQFQNLKDAVILPVDYLNPYDDPTGVLTKTSNTISIHWYGKSWMDSKTIIRSKITKPFHRIFGENCFDWIKK